MREGYRLIHVTTADPALAGDLRQVSGPVVLAVTADPETGATVAGALAEQVVGVILLGDAAKAPGSRLTVLVQAHGWPLRRVTAAWQDLSWRFWWRDWVTPRQAPFTVIVIDGR
ncbi:MAG: hypothetical protein H7338_09040 [Candidatus Sericytochromatia bacterium]|nr:hypothetical protein [Candidatus Sericytochromatia bacterium]